MATSATLRVACERQNERNTETVKLQKLGRGKSGNGRPGTVAGFALHFSFSLFFALPCIVDICEHRRWEHPSANLFQAPSSRYSARPHLCVCLQLHLHATVAHLLSLIRETKLHYFCTSAIKLQSSQGSKERKNVVCTITVVYISQKAKQERQRERAIARNRE